MDPSIYLTSSPIQFKDHEVTVSKQTSNITRVTFKNVPLNIPDEEIINLCKSYGKPINNLVKYDKPSRMTKGVIGSIRHVEMELLPGKQFENFYWLEGPLEGDIGSRITVLHNGQVQQCSHCLRRADSCPGLGIGKVCQLKGTARGMMSDYMRHLKLQHNYVSLKIQFQNQEFPQLGGQKHLSDGFNHMDEAAEDITEITVVEKDDCEKDCEIEYLRKELYVTKSMLEKVQLKRKPIDNPDVTKVVKLVSENTNNIVEYDPEQDRVITNNEMEFTRMMKQHCKEGTDPEKKLDYMKNQVLEKFRILERKRLGLKPSRSRSLRRGRSEDSDSEAGSVKSIRMASSLSDPIAH